MATNRADGATRNQEGDIMTLEELSTELEQLRRQVKTLLNQTQYREYDDLSGVEYKRTDGEALLLSNEYRGILWKLSDIEWTLEYLSRPVEYTDTLVMDESGRYHTKNGRRTYTSGSGIEFEYLEEVYNSDTEDWENVKTWGTSRVEHNGERYYIVGYSTVELDGLKVRVRR